jgi:hypothetical protein
MKPFTTAPKIFTVTPPMREPGDLNLSDPKPCFKSPDPALAVMTI